MYVGETNNVRFKYDSNSKRGLIELVYHKRLDIESKRILVMYYGRENHLHPILSCSEIKSVLVQYGTLYKMRIFFQHVDDLTHVEFHNLLNRIRNQERISKDRVSDDSYYYELRRKVTLSELFEKQNDTPPIIQQSPSKYKGVVVIYNDSSDNWNEKTVNVYRDGFEEITDSEIRYMHNYSLTSEEQARRYGRWLLETGVVDNDECPSKSEPLKKPVLPKYNDVKMTHNWEQYG